MRKKQKGADRRRGTVIVTVCVARRASASSPPPSCRSCSTSGSDSQARQRRARRDRRPGVGLPGDHHQDGRRQPGPRARSTRRSTTRTRRRRSARTGTRPASRPASFARKFYTADDRPALEALVHNLEHGYTILWYDETIAKDADRARRRSRRSPASSAAHDFRDKFIAAPWTSSDEDGATFPDGQHVAFTHWSAGGDGETDTDQAGRRLPVLLRASAARPSTHVHGQVPLHRLPRARRDVSTAARAARVEAGAGQLRSARSGRTPSARRRSA